MPSDTILGPPMTEGDLTTHEAALRRMWDYERVGTDYAIQCTCGRWTPTAYSLPEAEKLFREHQDRWATLLERAKELEGLTLNERLAKLHAWLPGR